jgi:hypothetical protein
MKYFITTNCIFIEFDKNTRHIIDKTHINYDKISSIIRTEEDNIETCNKITNLLNIKQSISDYYKGNIHIKNGVINFVHGKKEYVLDNRITRTIIDTMKTKNGDYKKLVNFLNKLMKNPSADSVDSFYDFIVHYNLEIIETGNVILYKVVDKNYNSKYIGSDRKIYSNKPGKRVSMPRHMVDDNRNIHCSSGLHICSKKYIPEYYRYGDKIVRALLNPKDVVSVPTDCDFSKIRICDYKVIDDVTEEIIKELSLR